MKRGRGLEGTEENVEMEGRGGWRRIVETWSVERGGVERGAWRRGGVDAWRRAERGLLSDQKNAGVGSIQVGLRFMSEFSGLLGIWAFSLAVWRNFLRNDSPPPRRKTLLGARGVVVPKKFK